MTALIPFAFDSHAVRTLDTEGQTWFVAKDVASALGYVNQTEAIKRHCKGVAKRAPLETSGGVQELNLISEPDVFRLIVASHLPAAQQFERWLFEEVLPSIRRSGQYGQRDWIGEQQRIVAMADAIEAEHRKEVRTALHGELAAFCEHRGLPVPSLVGLTRRRTPIVPRRPDPALAAAFWKAQGVCEAAGARLDHSRNPAVRAYNLPQLRLVAESHGQPLPDGLALGDALRADPRFVATTAVNSALSGRTVKAWLFWSAEPNAL